MRMVIRSALMHKYTVTRRPPGWVTVTATRRNGLLVTARRPADRCGSAGLVALPGKHSELDNLWFAYRRGSACGWSGESALSRYSSARPGTEEGGKASGSSLRTRTRTSSGWPAGGAPLVCRAGQAE
jgi:hypothetical protein